MNFKNLHNLIDDTREWADNIPFDYDYIVGIPDSGLLVGHILSIVTSKPMVDCTNSEKTLVVDDTALSGKTVRMWREYFPKAKFGALYAKKSNQVDYYHSMVPPPRIFEWNWFKSAHLRNSMVDIDGILCRDPTKEETDYGEKMESFYKTVKPKTVPHRDIGTLVTGRLDKYRNITEQWLTANNIRCRRLAMRHTRDQGHAEFKSSLYKNSSAILFIESSLKQARTISELSGKPVLCYETMEML